MIEDCLYDSFCVKMDDYEDYKFFVFYVFCYNEESDDEIMMFELNVFVGLNYVVMIYKYKMGWFCKMDVVCLCYLKFMNCGVDFLLYVLIDGIMDEYFLILDWIDMCIDELEDEIYNKEVCGVMEEFLVLKRMIILICCVILF